jgi:hypothetical protein
MPNSEKKKKSDGLRLAAAYGLPPNRLGFCGPQGRVVCQKIKDFAKNSADREEMRSILSRFEAAYAYLELIADKNRISDPFDRKVVEAFWIGNNLLDSVSGEDIKRMVLEKFVSPELLSQTEAKKRFGRISQDARPHHSFHVYVLGTITGRVSLADAGMKDVCRVGWGKVKKIRKTKKNHQVWVEYVPIIRKKSRFVFGNLSEKIVSWDENVVAKVSLGDWVAFHWNQIAQTITLRQKDNLKKYTALTLRNINQ